MASYVVCHVCGEKTRTTFSFCWKCGAKISAAENLQETSLPPLSALSLSQREDYFQKKEEEGKK